MIKTFLLENVRVDVCHLKARIYVINGNSLLLNTIYTVASIIM